MFKAALIMLTMLSTINARGYFNMSSDLCTGSRLTWCFTYNFPPEMGMGDGGTNSLAEGNDCQPGKIYQKTDCHTTPTYCETSPLSYDHGATWQCGAVDCKEELVSFDGGKTFSCRERNAVSISQIIIVGLIIVIVFLGLMLLRKTKNSKDIKEDPRPNYNQL